MRRTGVGSWVHFVASSLLVAGMLTACGGGSSSSSSSSTSAEGIGMAGAPLSAAAGLPEVLHASNSSCSSTSTASASASSSSSSTGTSTQVAGDTVTLSWDPPTEYTNGAVLTTLAGYHIHYGTQPEDYPKTIQVANPGISTYVVQGLSPGTYYFAVSDYDATGAESDYSPEITVTVGGSDASTVAASSTGANTSSDPGTSGSCATSTADGDPPTSSTGGVDPVDPPPSSSTGGVDPPPSSTGGVDPPASSDTELGIDTLTASASVDSGDENTMAGSPITVGAQPIAVSAITLWINDAQAAPNNRFEVAIYTDHGGRPGSLVAASNAQSISPQSWNTVPLSAALSANTKYWLLYNTNSTVASLNEMSLSPSTVSTGWYSGRPGSASFGTWPKTAASGYLQSPQQAYAIFATYQTVQSTLGSNTLTPPATVDSGDESTMAGSPITVGAQPISISSLTVWINNAQAAPNNQFEVAIYTDNGGRPGSLVVASGSQTIVPQSWNTVPLSAPLSANTKYWLLYNTNSTVPTLNEMSLSASTTSTGWYSGRPGSASFGAWPNAAPQGHLQSPQLVYSIYVSYQAAPGTLGSTAPPSATDSGDQNTMSGSSITVGAEPISVSSVTVWINGAQAEPNNQFEVAIYTANGGRPGSLVAASNAQSISPESWNTVPLTAKLSANATYWLLYNTNATNSSLNEMSLSASSAVNSWYSGRPGSAEFGKWPSGAPAGYLQSSAEVYSIYLEYH